MSEELPRLCACCCCLPRLSARPAQRAPPRCLGDCRGREPGSSDSSDRPSLGGLTTGASVYLPSSILPAPRLNPPKLTNALPFFCCLRALTILMPVFAKVDSDSAHGRPALPAMTCLLVRWQAGVRLQTKLSRSQAHGR